MDQSPDTSRRLTDEQKIQLIDSMRNKGSYEAARERLTATARIIADRVSAAIPGQTWKFTEDPAGRKADREGLSCKELTGDIARRPIADAVIFGTAFSAEDFKVVTNIVREEAAKYGATTESSLFNESAKRDYDVQGNVDFGALPPEINSGRMYCGPGSGPMLAAAAAWDGVAVELGLAATGYASVIAELTGAPWVGAASLSMVAAATPYVAWLSQAAARAEQAGMQAAAAAAAYEAAFVMTVPPPVITANRVLVMTLIATNFFGQNSAAIAVAEAQYAEMWAQDAVAMYGYAAASASASRLIPFAAPPKTTNSAGVVAQPTASRTRAATSASAASSCTGSASCGVSGSCTQLVQPPYSGLRASRTGSASGIAQTTKTASLCLGRKSSRSARTDSAVQMCRSSMASRPSGRLTGSAATTFAAARSSTHSSVLSAAAGPSRSRCSGRTRSAWLCATVGNNKNSWAATSKRFSPIPPLRSSTVCRPSSSACTAALHSFSAGVTPRRAP